MIYVDHAATTPVRPEVLEAMIPYFSETFGNPSGIYQASLAARRALDEAREMVARSLGARSASEIVLTGGGSEADNLAILGLARAYRERGNHVITSSVEHHAVLHPCRRLEREGFEVTVLPVDEQGVVKLESLERALRPGTILVSVMLANNEVGSLQPVGDIVRAARKVGALVHTDAVQAVGKIPVDVNALGVDALTLSAHKLYGPKGVGALFLRSGLRLEPLIYGGGQEKGRRSGTENVSGAVGMARALQLASAELPAEAERLEGLRKRLVSSILEQIPGVRLTGHPERRLPGLSSFVFSRAQGESILMNLDRQGIAASTGSACSTATLEPSHVLKAMGIPLELSHGSLRLSLGRSNEDTQVDSVVAALKQAVEKLRRMAPRELKAG